MKVIILVFVALLLKAEGTNKVPDNLLAEYWKTKSVYDRYETDFQRSLTSEQKAILEAQGKKLPPYSKASQAILDFCGGPNSVDLEAAKQDEIKCLPKVPTTPK